MKTYVVTPQYLVNKELKELSENAIKSFRDTSDVIIISVNDGAYKYNLKKLSDVYLENETNQGFAKTCNKGFQWIFDNIKEDCYIVCANNDIEVYKGWIEEMQYPFNKWYNVAVTGICHSKEKIIFGKHLSEYKDTKITEGGLNSGIMQDGALWMSKKSILQKVGTFDERFERGGYEDTDLFLRMRDTFGMKIIMSARAWYWHKEGQTRWGVSEEYKADCKVKDSENRRKFQEKWGYDYMKRQVWRSNQLVN